MTIIEFLNNSYILEYFWVAASLIVGLLFFYRHKSTRSVRRRAYAGAIASYTMFVLFFTVIGRNAGNRISYNLFLDNINTHFILNCIMFMPIGYMLPRLKSYKATVLFGFILSCCIEVLQLIMRRGTFEIGDIIGNSLGTVIGCILCYKWRLLKGIRSNHHHHHHHHSHSHSSHASVQSRAWRSR